VKNKSAAELQASQRLCRAVEAEVTALSQKSRGLKPSEFLMSSLPCPYAYCKLGFIDNKADLEQFDTPAKQRNFAAAYAKGILNFLGVPSGDEIDEVDKKTQTASQSQKTAAQNVSEATGNSAPNASEAAGNPRPQVGLEAAESVFDALSVAPSSSSADAESRFTIAKNSRAKRLRSRRKSRIASRSGSNRKRFRCAPRSSSADAESRFGARPVPHRQRFVLRPRKRRGLAKKVK
jgi:hypothetical protein